MRPETGKMKFGDDWTGIFIRGDQAMALGIAISELLQIITPTADTNTILAIRMRDMKNLIELLNSCMEYYSRDKVLNNVQKLKSFEECKEATHAEND